MSILFDIRFQLDATINCTFSNLNSKVETMGLGTCRSREKMSEDELPNSIVSKVNVRKNGFMHLHISSLGQNIIALFSIIWVKICEKIWVYALACCRGREKSEGEDGGLRYTVTRLFTTFQCFSSICIIVFLNNS